MIISTTAQRNGTEPENRLVRQITWLVSVTTDQNEVFEAIMVFSEQPAPKDIQYYYERRPDMFRKKK